MADGGPDIQQQLLAMQSLINSSASNGKPSFLFGVIPLDWQAGGSLSMQSLSPFAKNVPTIFNGTGGKPGGIAAKFLEAIQSIPEDLRKRAQEAGVMYAGNITNGDGMPQGGSGISAPSSGYEVG